MPDLLPSLATVLAEDANVADELRGAGIAFGTLVERTGAGSPPRSWSSTPRARRPPRRWPRRW